MKKFLVCLLFLIPVIVVAALSATTGLISAYAVIPATEVRVLDATGKAIDGILSVDVDGTVDFYISVYPRSAFDKRVKLSGDILSQIGDEYNDGRGVVEIEEISDAGQYRMRGVTSGEVEIRITSKTDEGIYGIVRCYVNGKKLIRIDIVDEEGETVKDKLSISSPIRLVAHAYPLEAIGENDFVWTSSNENVASVRNGYIRPMGQGEAVITVSGKDLTGEVYSETFVLDTENARLSMDKITCFETPTEEWVRERLVICDTAVDSISIAGGSISVLFADGISASCGYSFVKDSAGNQSTDRAQIEFLTAYSELYYANGGYKFHVKYADDTKSGTPSVSFSSGNERLLRVDSSGQASFVSDGFEVGTVTVTATDTLTLATCSMTFEIRQRARTFSLNMTKNDNLAGLKNERVWGLSFYREDMSMHRQFQLSVDDAQVVPAGANPLIKWESSDEGVAVSQKGLVTFSESACGKSVIITAIAMVNGFETSLKKTYTFKLLDDPNSVNVYAESQLRNGADGGRPIALQSNILIDNTVSLRSDIYGNGYMITSTSFILASKINKQLLYANHDLNREKITYNIENLTFMTMTYEQFEEFGAFSGEALAIFTNGIDPERAGEISVNISYCQFNNCVTGIVLLGPSTTNVERTIMSNIGGMGINVRYTRVEYGKLTVDRLVHKNSRSPAVFAPPPAAGGSINPEYDTTPEMKITNLKCYTWATKEGLSFFSSIIELDSLNPELANLISSELTNVIQDVFEKDDFNHLKFHYKGTDYYHLAFVTLGLWSYTDISKITYPENYAMLPFALPDKLKIMGVTLGTEGLEALVERFTGVKASIRHENYLFSYDFANETPDYLPNEPVPSDDALYSFVRGTDTVA